MRVLASREAPFHWSSGVVTETIPERRSGRAKSRPPHALIESRLKCFYYQISLDWTTSFLSDNPILKPRHKAVKMFRCHRRFHEGSTQSKDRVTAFFHRA